MVHISLATVASQTAPVVASGFVPAVLKNIGEVADEADTSPEQIRHNYKKMLPRREAARWFNISPETADILQVEFRFSEKA